jgi:para-aminobenzoate synthetase component 1
MANLNEPLVEELTPLGAWDACRRLAALPHVLFLDSAAPSAFGRYSFVAADPMCWLTSNGNAIFENGNPIATGDPLAHLAKRLDEFKLDTLPGLPPFQGGWAGLLGYELCHHIERLPRAAFVDFAIPDLALGCYDWVLAFDLGDNRCWLVSTGWPETDPTRRRDRAQQRMAQVKRWIDTPLPPPEWSPTSPITMKTPQHPKPGLDGVTSNFSRAEYEVAVQRAIDYVHAGDCFQVNIAQRLTRPARLPPLEMYDRLRLRNPAPFAGYFDLGDWQILSASPERFLQMNDRQIVTRPIKGTRPRGMTPQEDAARAEDLRTSDKDRAENVMIVDLLRNDLGRVCDYGSVRVEAVCKLESYRYVHHLVSEVRGTLRAGLSPVDLLRAAFPGGSITGAPKVRAMQIITELERTARGPYCGSLGYLSFDGALDTNLLIRTLVQGAGRLHFAVGGGIVADSTPAKEYAETWHKAEGLLRAMGE